MKDKSWKENLVKIKFFIESKVQKVPNIILKIKDDDNYYRELNKREIVDLLIVTKALSILDISELEKKQYMNSILYGCEMDLQLGWFLSLISLNYTDFMMYSLLTKIYKFIISLFSNKEIIKSIEKEKTWNITVYDGYKIFIKFD